MWVSSVGPCQILLLPVVLPEADGEERSVQVSVAFTIVFFFFSPGPSLFPAELWGGMIASPLLRYMSSFSQ